MRRRAVPVVCAFALGLCATSAFSADAPNVLPIAAERSVSMKFMLIREVFVMIDRPTDAGYQVVVASRSGTPIGADDVVLTPDL